MESLDSIYVDFIEKFKAVLSFISENFGNREILLRKNQGLILSRNLDVKKSKITGYIFHGSGCEFRFKNTLLDIEFDQDHIGFTGWSFYFYSQSINPQITEIETDKYLRGKVRDSELKYSGRIFMLNR